jgi:ABC-type transporter Mla maintaining outer membrane lipid asymmetry ATPase subunit MlaF
VDSALERVALSDKTDLYPGDLSTGQQQRVGIARAIVHRPALLLADEPTGNLDPRLAAEIMGVFEDINRLGTSVLIASHDLALIAHAPPHADPAARSLDRRRGGRRMSATRSPKVSERVAPKAADPQPTKKKATTTMARTSHAVARLDRKPSRQPAGQPAPPGQAADRQLFHLPGDGGGAEHAHGPVAAAK